MSEPSTNTVDICLVTWNGATMLPPCLESLRRQTFTSWQLNILDNGSRDETMTILNKWVEDYGGTVWSRTNNLGFAPAHNILIRATRSPFVLVLNQDVELEPDYLDRLVKVLASHPTFGSGAGLLFRADRINGAWRHTDIIDNAGLKIFSTHRVVERQRGERDVITGASYELVFGVPATAVLYRRRALDQVAFARGLGVEYFDELFGSYKEDVDLAYRLQLAGWGSICVRQAVGYHRRGLRGEGKVRSFLGNHQTLKNRWRRHDWQNRQSYRNHLILLGTDFFFPIWSATWWWTTLYEKGKFFVLLVTEPGTLLAWREIGRWWTMIMKKRACVRAPGVQLKRISDWF